MFHVFNLIRHRKQSKAHYAIGSTETSPFLFRLLRLHLSIKLWGLSIMKLPAS